MGFLDCFITAITLAILFVSNKSEISHLLYSIHWHYYVFISTHPIALSTKYKIFLTTAFFYSNYQPEFEK